MLKVKRQYWWDGTPNFGDLLGPDIVSELLGVSLPLAKGGDDSVLLGVGSIIDYCGKFESSVVWGSGIDPHYGKVPALSKVKFLAVRGPLTRKHLGIDVPALGDPALLLPRIFPCQPKGGPISIVVHHSTTKRRWRDFLFDPYRTSYRIIDPRQQWREVVNQICESDFVFCQSLHGAIIAEAYGVPWAWWQGLHGRLATFKWHDFFGSISVPPQSFRLCDLAKARRWRDATRSKVPDLDALQSALTENVKAAPSPTAVVA